MVAQAQTRQFRCVPFRGTVGEFLCVHNNAPRVDDVDVITITDLDVRQEAAERVIRGWTKMGKRLDEQDTVGSINADGGMAKQVVDWTFFDAKRALLGKGKADRRPVRTPFIHGDQGDITAMFVDSNDVPEEATSTDYIKCVCDPYQTECLEAIENNYDGVILDFYTNGIPMNWNDPTGPRLDVETSRNVICLLNQIQEMKGLGLERVPDDLRQQLSRLRKKAKKAGFDLSLMTGML